MFWSERAAEENLSRRHAPQPVNDVNDEGGPMRRGDVEIPLAGVPVEGQLARRGPYRWCLRSVLR